jgi:hypothetical protein
VPLKPNYLNGEDYRKKKELEFAPRPGNKKCPAKRLGTVVLVFAEREGLASPIP